MRKRHGERHPGTSLTTRLGTLLLIGGLGIAAGPARVCAEPAGNLLWWFQGIENVESVAALADQDGDGVAEAVVMSYDAGAPSGDDLFLIKGNSVDYGEVIWSTKPYGGLSGGGGYGDQCLSTIADIGGDGLDDVLLGTAWGGRTAFALDGATGAEFFRYDSYENPPSGWCYAVNPIPDLNGDGTDDVLAAFGNDQRAALALDGASAGPATVLWKWNANFDGVLSACAIGDVNGSGVDDALLGCGGNFVDDRVVAIEGGSTGEPATLIWQFDTGGTVQDVSTIADVNGSGVDDALAGGWANTVFCLEGATGAVIWQHVVGTVIMKVEPIADVNGDGIDDVLVGSWDHAILCLDGADGSTIWIAPTGGLNGGDVWTVAPIPDVDGDGIEDALGGSFDTKVWCVSGATGQAIWTYTTGNRLYSVRALPDANGDGVPEAIAGTQMIGGSGGRAYAIEGDSQGPWLDVAAAPDSAIVPAGGSAGITVSLTNTTAAAQTFDAWMEVRTPWNRTIPVERVDGITMPAGAVVSPHLDEPVPGSAPSGIYTVVVAVGAYGTTVVDADSFDLRIVNPAAGMAGGDAAGAMPTGLPGWDLSGIRSAVSRIDPEARTADGRVRTPEGIDVGSPAADPGARPAMADDPARRAELARETARYISRAISEVGLDAAKILEARRTGAIALKPIHPRPTENILDDEAEARNKSRRKAFFERMHAAAPGVDWRAIERENGLAAMARRRAAIEAAGPGTESMVDGRVRFVGTWRELGSRNQAGRMHSAAWSPDGLTLYSGSDRGGLWAGALDGTGWTPLGDNLYGGVHEVGVVPATGGGPDILIRLYSDMVHRTTDGGVTWDVPAGLGNIRGTKRILVLDDGPATVFLLIKQSFGWKVFVSTDRGASFSASRTLVNEGDIWTPRDAVGPVYLVDTNRIYETTDRGQTWTPVGTQIPASGMGGAVLTGSEHPALAFDVAVSTGGGWELWRSTDTGQTWTYLRNLDDFWQSLVASSQDPDRIAYGGVEVYVTRDGGATFTKVNNWGDYYGDPANRLHADIPGLFVDPDPTAPQGEIWYVGTDGGLYDSDDGLDTVHNLSLSGLGVSQYYSTHTSRRRPDIVLAGAQDQGYQRGVLPGTPPPPPGPWADFDQLISGDYGHLTSGDGSHDTIFSDYPGFVLVQRGEDVPHLVAYLDFPSGESYLWLPPITADPTDPSDFYFCGRHLYRYDKVNNLNWWNYSQFSAQDFAPGVLSALAFSPIDPKRAWAATSTGRLFVSDDGGVTWTQSADIGPDSHYFYGTALLPSSTDIDVCWAGGSGYSNPPVYRTTDGGVTWRGESAGLPSTLVYGLVEAPDGSGDLFAGSENGAWRYSAATGTWSDLLGADAPITTYWSCETVPSQNLVRFGTYGRGIWDYSLNTPGYFPYGELLGAPNVLTLRGAGQPLIGRSTTLTVTGCPPGAAGQVAISTAAADAPMYGGTRLVELPDMQRFDFHADADGIATVTLTIPNDAGLVGQESYLQAGAVDPAQVQNVALSHGLRALVGE